MPRKKKQQRQPKALKRNPNPDKLSEGEQFYGRVWHLVGGWREKKLTYVGTRQVRTGYMYVARDEEGNEFYFNAGTWNVVPRR